MSERQPATPGAPKQPAGDASPAQLPEPPPYEPDDALITDLEKGLTPESLGLEQR